MNTRCQYREYEDAVCRQQRDLRDKSAPPLRFLNDQGRVSAVLVTKPDFPLSDYGNAERIVRDHGENLKYCSPFGKWFIWDNARWHEDETGEHIRHAKDSVRRIHAEADRIKPGEGRDEYERKALGGLRDQIFKHALKSEESNEIDAMLKLSQSENGIPVLPDDLDRDSFSLCVSNGIIDLRTGSLKLHDRCDLITKLAPVVYDSTAKCPRWESFLLEVFGDDCDVVSYVQRAVGYSLTADQREQVLFFLHGKGSNGKSTFMEILAKLFGDYSQKAPSSLVLSNGKGGDKIPNDVARLKGARLVSCSELEENCIMAEATVKNLTGGDKQVARFMRGEFFEFYPTHKLWMLGNHKPSIRGTDHGIWRRIHLIPFMVTFGDDRKDQTLPEKLKDELVGILAWAVQGCLEWQAFGLNPPAIVKAAVQEYRESEDHVGLFLDDSCTLHAKSWASSKALYTAFRNWCESAGEMPLGNKAFTNRLRDRGFKAKKSGGERGWIGVSIQQHVDTSDSSKDLSG
jgi:putative DNA primase/helicase